MSARLWRAVADGQSVVVGRPVQEGRVVHEDGLVIDAARAWSRHRAPGAPPLTSADLTAGRTLPEVWSQRWRVEPHRPVLLEGRGSGSSLDGDALAHQTARAAGALAGYGVVAGDRVLWSCVASLDAITALLGALRLGAVVVPVNPSATRSELRYVAGDVDPAVCVVERPESTDWLRADAADVVVRTPRELLSEGRAGDVPLDAAAPGDDALIVYTSGTTGEPKGAVHTHASLLAGTLALQMAWGWQPDDRLILALPLFHVHGLCAGLFGTLAAGASAVVFERFVPEQVLDAVPSSTMFFGVPTMYHRLAESGRAGELSPLRLCVAGSAPLPADLWRRFDGDWGVPVLERYGMSETLLTLSNPLEGERRPGSVGFPLPGVEAAIAEPDGVGIGELMVRGPSLCRGYWQRADASAAMWQDGWFATGDLASVAEDGYISIRGRRTELIITGGHNVYPAEVEAVLARHPSVGEIAVIGLPSAEWGESVTAFVVGLHGAPDLDALTLLATQELTSYKRPREFRVVDALPRNAMGKVVRRDLR
jgi:malonyl-CoA/methylmalonyl-CoA synthetase